MSYTHLSTEERFTLQKLDVQGKSYRYMAHVLSRHHSTIAREFKRNALREKYLYTEAHELASDRIRQAHQRPRLKSPKMRAHVERKIKEGWSPEQIAGRLRQQRSSETVSYEAIYQWLYLQRIDLCVYLCRRRKFRYPRDYSRKRLQSVIPLRVCISQRPESVQARKITGHWEADTMSLPTGDSQALAVSVERVTRYVHIDRLPNMSPTPMRQRLEKFFLSVPKRLRRSITYDNGFENREHYKINQTCNMDSYFCQPYHSWEKGTVENTIGLLRRFIPKNKPIGSISHKELRHIQDRINNRPRKCLDFRTPKELFNTVALTA